MKNKAIIITLMLPLFFLAQSCKDKKGCTDPTAINYDSEADEDDGSCIYPGMGTFTLDIKAMANQQPLVLFDSLYKNILDYNYTVERIAFYLSNLYLIKDNGDEVLAKEVDYLKFETHHSVYSNEGEKITVSVPAGNYQGIKFAIGVDSTLNFGDPSVYASSHPLSIFNNAHWNWNTGYIFLKFEGRMDSVPNGNGDLTQLFLYHTGTNPLYRETAFSEDFSIAEGGSFQYNLELDVDEIFYSESDTLDVNVDNFTHTAGNFDLAERVANLFAHAIKER